MTLLSLLGLIGGFCFSYCGVPSAYKTFRARKSIGSPIFVAWMIVLGSIFMYSYLIGMYGFDLLLAFNYGIQTVSWSIIVYYHYFPKAET